MLLSYVKSARVHFAYLIGISLLNHVAYHLEIGINCCIGKIALLAHFLGSDKLKLIRHFFLVIFINQVLVFVVPGDCNVGVVGFVERIFQLIKTIPS